MVSYLTRGTNGMYDNKSNCHYELEYDYLFKKFQIAEQYNLYPRQAKSNF
jgi:hypothetical protein